jgi:multicomponent Na+:H+ antiporter subunit D
MTPALMGVLGYLVLGVLGFLTTRARLLSGIALLVGVTSFSLWFPGFPPDHLGLGIWAIPWQGDPLAAAFWGLSLFLHLILLLSERGWPRHFYALLTLLVGTILSLVLSLDLFNLYVSLELTSLIAFLLVGIEGRPAQVWASLKYLILTSCGMILYLLGVGFVYAKTGTLSLLEISSTISSGDLGLSLGVGLLVAGAAAKGGVFLLALWLPTAHGYAPSPVSALLSGLVVKMGIITLARLSTAFPIGNVLVAIGLVTGFLGVLHLFWEEDIKVFLAYSTMSQLGYILLGFGWEAWAGATAYGVAHGLFKALLFLAAGRAETEGRSRHISKLAGRLCTGTRLSLGVGTLAIVGLPPFIGYGAKGLLSSAAPPWGKWALFVLTLGTAASFTKLLPSIIRGKKAGMADGPPLLLSAAIFGGGLFLLIREPALRSFPLLLSTVGAIIAGGIVSPLMRKLPVSLPRWRLDESFLAFLFSAALLALWFLVR